MQMLVNEPSAPTIRERSCPQTPSNLSFWAWSGLGDSSPKSRNCAPEKRILAKSARSLQSPTSSE